MAIRKGSALPVPGEAQAHVEKPSLPTGRDKPERDGFEDLLGYQLRRAQRALYAHFSEELAEYRLTPGQIGLIFNIREKPGISQAALAKGRGIERATLGPIIDRFEQRGLVERRNSPHDRRSYALHLTAKGRKLLAAVWPRLVEHEEDFFAVLSATERRRLSDYLARIAGAH